MSNKSREKKEFTEILQEKAHLAKEPAQPLSSTKVCDGAGAIIINDHSEKGYDLRLTEEKGILPPHHPVRLAAKLNPKPMQSKIAFIEQVKSESGFASAKFVQLPSPLETKLYADPLHLCLPSPESDIFFVPLEENQALAFAKNAALLDTYTEIPPKAFHLGYLEFAHHILINNGNGRISAIENILKSHAPTKWQVTGTYIHIPGNWKQSQFLEQGLLVSERNLSEEGATLNIPVSIFDLQIEDIVNKLKTVTKEP